MVKSKIYGFPPPSKMIDVGDGVAAVGYKLPSTPPLLILNRRTPHVLNLVPGREYVVVNVLREAHKICIAMSVTLGIAAVQKSAEDTLIGAELVQKML